MQVGIGPQPSRALAFVTSFGKTLEVRVLHAADSWGPDMQSRPFACVQAGRLEASACIRYFHWELCPVGALADRIVCELSGPRLTLTTLAKSHVLRAPGSLGDKPMSPSWFTVQIGQVLRDAGMLNIATP